MYGTQLQPKCQLTPEESQETAWKMIRQEKESIAKKSARLFRKQVDSAVSRVRRRHRRVRVQLGGRQSPLINITVVTVVGVGLICRS